MKFYRGAVLALLAVCGGFGVHGAAGAGKEEAVAYQIDVAHSGSATLKKFKTPLKFKWNVYLGGPVSYPLIAEGMVFVTTPQKNSTRLVALDLKTGAIVWQTPIGGANNSWSGAAYDKGTVFVVDLQGAVEAFNAKTGKVKWGEQILTEYTFTAPPIAVDGRLFVSGYGDSGMIYAFDEKHGGMLWATGTNGGPFSSPALGDGSLYLAYDCDVYDVAPDSGSVVWHYTYGCFGGSGKTPVYASGRLYARDQINPDTIFNGADGTILGTYTASVPPMFFKGAGGNSLEAVLDNSTLTVLDPDTGAVTWHFTGDGGLTIAPIAINGHVIAGSGYGMLYVLDGDTGAVEWSTNVGSAILAPNEFEQNPLVGLGAGDGMLVVPADGNLVAYATH